MFHSVEIGMPENGSFTGCTLVSIPKTSHIQTAAGGFEDASNCFHSLKAENETPGRVWKARTTM
jgi:hypothetical protein